MNNAFKKLAQAIYFHISPNFKNVTVKSAKLINSKKFAIEFIIPHIIPLQEMVSFHDALNNNFKYPTNVYFYLNHYELSQESVNLKNYLRWIVGDLLKKPKLAEIIFISSIAIEDKQLTITCEEVHVYQSFHLILKNVNTLLNSYGFNHLQLKIKFEEPQEDILHQDREEHLSLAKLSHKVKTPTNNSKTNYGRGYEQVTISNLKDSTTPNVAIAGEIFAIDEKVTSKQDLVIFELSVTDFKDAITVKKFVKTATEREDFKKSFQVNDYVVIEGAHQFDAYKKQMTILARKIVKSINPHYQRIDEAKTKRIELSMRTQMSTMDGVVNPRQIIEKLSLWQHEAVAIVDWNSVQSFPDFYQASKKSSLKPIYGATLSTINKNIEAIKNPRDDRLLEEQTYVVFDLETTGLSPIFDDIIEFGGVKIKNHEIIQRVQFFIKPTKLISDEITRITNITNEHVKDAISEKSAMQKILDFIGDSTLIAHNANFDMGFIYEKLVKYNYRLINNTVIDTLIVARMIHPKAKKFKLENYVSRLGVEYDLAAAHRADYDAHVLAQAWILTFSFLRNLNINTEQDLATYLSHDLYAKTFSHEVTVLVKNQAGLKDLFHLISLTLTNNYFNSPKLFFNDLKISDNILLGSGALKSRLVNKMLRGSKQDIIEEISHYDYIEVQPRQNYLHLINDNFTIENLNEIINFVIIEAKKQNKIVVATGDVRYLEAKDRIYHEIYVYAKGLGGERHYLYNYHQKEQVLPYQHLLTTNEMKAEFKFLEDINLIDEIVVKNTHLIANQIERVEVIKNKLYTPNFTDADKNLRALVFANAQKIYGHPLPIIVKERLEQELAPLKKYGFSVIYWISQLLVAKSLKDGYLVGSRGSIGSSLVATMANITEVNPLPPHYICSLCQFSEFHIHQKLNSGFDLLPKRCQKCQIDLIRDGQNIPFETFLGFEANKVPDIDLNFSGEYQYLVHEEVKKLFGETHSFRAGTISTVAERTAFGYIKNWEEMRGVEVSDAFRKYLAKGVAGTKRTTGQHPGGIIVIPEQFVVEDFTPINFPANDVNSPWKTTHFDFHAIHDNVLKLDLLGHDDPTAIKYLELLTGVKAKTIPTYDNRVISLFSSPKELGISSQDINNESTGVMGIPEFGTKFVRGMLKSVQVKNFGDLISISGLSHGTDVWTNNAELLVKNKGLKLNQLISCRDDIMNDLILKGIDSLESFKIMEQVRKGNSITNEQEQLLKTNNVEQWYIDSLKKIKYMFPKAHATAYVMMAWRIAWYKLYYPLAYYATYFSTRADVSEIETLTSGKTRVEERLKELLQNRFKRGENVLSNKEQALIPILEIANEAYARGIKILNVDVHKSDANEWLMDLTTNSIIAPFNTLDGLGETAAKSIVKARKEKPFTSRQDLLQRTPINKTVFKKMVDNGILEQLYNSDQISFDFN